MRRPRGFWQWVFAAAGLAGVLAAVGAAFLRWESPLRRSWVEQALEQRYGHAVSLQTFHSSLFPRARVSGTGLVLGADSPGMPPLVEIASFSADASWLRLLFGAPRLGHVQLQGLQLNIPPHGKRSSQNLVVRQNFHRAMVLESVVADGTVLRIYSNPPGRPPRVFYIQRLRLRAPASGGSMLYSAELTNPRPVGQIVTTGTFGPWDADDPGSSPVQGQYSFDRADLSSIAGLSGVLSSEGNFTGSLQKIEVRGMSDTPNFALGQQGNPEPLHTTFQLLVDGTSGDTVLQKVNARLAGSVLEVSGIVQPSAVPGTEIDLDVEAGRGAEPARLEDLLALAVKAAQPPMKGNVALRAHIHIPPTREPVDKRMQMKGGFQIRQATFTDPGVRANIANLSERGQGHPGVAAAPGDNDTDSTAVGLQGDFQMARGRIDFSRLQFAVPGATVRLTGSYDMPSQALDFKGTVQLDAKLSQMTTGWKSLVLRPFNRIFEHGTSGTLLPLTITGERAHPEFHVSIRNAITGHGLPRP
ncbi:MAG TPA: hypothetical protein VN709_07210 [Terriglobales bacterium]|nr:hypothetical protein [Terriglobales bacterium]